MRSEKEYENFILHIEWRHMEPGGNSGVFVWSNAQPNPSSRLPNGVDIDCVLDRTERVPLDDANGLIYLKKYRLRGIGEHIEVWVADDNDKVSTDLDFPDGDCRNGERTEITDEQIAEDFDARRAQVDQTIARGAES